LIAVKIPAAVLRHLWTSFASSIFGLKSKTLNKTHRTKLANVKLITNVLHARAHGIGV